MKFISVLILFLGSSAFARIKALSVGYDEVCALSTFSEVKCWSRATNTRIEIPPFKHPTQIATEYFTNYVLDDGTIKSWGPNKVPKEIQQKKWTSMDISRFKKQRTVKNEHEVMSWVSDRWLPDPTYKCSLTEAGKKISCIDSSKYDSETGPRSFDTAEFTDTPFEVVTSDYAVCARSASEVKCWNFKKEPEPVKAPALNKPTMLTAGPNQICAVDGDDVVCWGSDNSTSVFSFGPHFDDPNFSQEELVQFLKTVASGSSPVRNKFLSALADYAGKNLDFELASYYQSQKIAANYLLASLVGPAINMNDSDYYQTKVLPAYQSSLDKLSLALGVSGISDLAADNSIVQRTVLMVLKASVVGMNDFLSFNDRLKTQQVLKAIDQAMTYPYHQTLVGVFYSIRENKLIFDKLRNSPKTSFLVATLDLSAEWLDKKVR